MNEFDTLEVHGEWWWWSTERGTYPVGPFATEEDATLDAYSKRGKEEAHV